MKISREQKRYELNMELFEEDFAGVKTRFERRYGAKQKELDRLEVETNEDRFNKEIIVFEKMITMGLYPRDTLPFPKHYQFKYIM